METKVSGDLFQESLVVHSLRKWLWQFQVLVALVALPLCQRFRFLSLTQQSGICEYYPATCMKICALI